MILDDFCNMERYENLCGGFGVAFDFIRRCRADLPPDGTYRIEDRRVYAVVQRYETQSEEKLLWEAHRRHIDIQYVASGKERIGYAPPGRMIRPQPYQEENDCDLARNTHAGGSLFLEEGQFAVFFPGEAHMPRRSAGGDGGVIKIVVKILQN